MKNNTTTKAKLNINALIVLMVSAMLLGFTGTTYAYYTSTENLDNSLITVGSEVYLAERFSPDNKWLPGETKVKEVYFGNQYSSNQVIRFTYDVEWFESDGTTPFNYTGTYTPATLNWTTEITGPGATWTKIGAYYYYNKVLEKGSMASPTTTPPVLTSVTFSPELSNDTGHAEDFSNKICRITIHMEAVGVNPDIAQAEWGVSFTGSGNSLNWS